MMVNFKFDALYIQVSLHREPPEVGLVEKLTGNLYEWNSTCQPYIESATALHDYHDSLHGNEMYYNLPIKQLL